MVYSLIDMASVSWSHHNEHPPCYQLFRHYKNEPNHYSLYHQITPQRIWRECCNWLKTFHEPATNWSTRKNRLKKICKNRLAKRCFSNGDHSMPWSSTFTLITKLRPHWSIDKFWSPNDFLNSSTNINKYFHTLFPHHSLTFHHFWIHSCLDSYSCSCSCFNYGIISIFVYIKPFLFHSNHSIILNNRNNYSDIRATKIISNEAKNSAQNFPKRSDRSDFPSAEYRHRW